MSGAANTKKCPFCAEEIKAEAIKCRYCGEMLEASDVKTRPVGDAALPVFAPPARPSAPSSTDDNSGAGDEDEDDELCLDCRIPLTQEEVTQLEVLCAECMRARYLRWFRDPRGEPSSDPNSDCFACGRQLTIAEVNHFNAECGDCTAERLAILGVSPDTQGAPSARPAPPEPDSSSEDWACEDCGNRVTPMEKAEFTMVCAVCIQDRLTLIARAQTQGDSRQPYDKCEGCERHLTVAESAQLLTCVSCTREQLASIESRQAEQSGEASTPYSEPLPASKPEAPETEAEETLCIDCHRPLTQGEETQLLSFCAACMGNRYLRWFRDSRGGPCPDQDGNCRECYRHLTTAEEEQFYTACRKCTAQSLTLLDALPDTWGAAKTRPVAGDPSVSNEGEPCHFCGNRVTALEKDEFASTCAVCMQDRLTITGRDPRQGPSLNELDECEGCERRLTVAEYEHLMGSCVSCTNDQLASIDARQETPEVPTVSYEPTSTPQREPALSPVGAKEVQGEKRSILGFLKGAGMAVLGLGFFAAMIGLWATCQYAEGQVRPYVPSLVRSIIFDAEDEAMVSEYLNDVDDVLTELSDDLDECQVKREQTCLTQAFEDAYDDVGSGVPIEASWMSGAHGRLEDALETMWRLHLRSERDAVSDAFLRESDEAIDEFQGAVDEWYEQAQR